MWVLVCATSGQAQEDLDRGKSAAQIFSSNCTACHRAPQGLAKRAGFGLAGFLRQHYTTGSAQAAAMAAYLASVGGEPPKAREARRAGDERTDRNGSSERRGTASLRVPAWRNPHDPPAVSSDPPAIIISVAPVPVPQDESSRHPPPVQQETPASAAPRTAADVSPPAAIMAETVPSSASPVGGEATLDQIGFSAPLP